MSTTKQSKLPSIALWLFAIAIALPGIVALIAPTVLAGHGLSIDGLNEARAIGGTRLAVAVVLALAARRVDWRRPGLVAGCIIFGATLIGRIASNVIDGWPAAMIKPESLEVVLLAFAFVALRAAR
jgi:hypothetical protein